MKILVDTHAFLWLIVDDPRLSPSAKKIIADTANILFLSAASAWEFAIKVRSGKLTITEEPESYLTRFMALYHLQPLPVEIRHALHTYRLPLMHRDPFDRLLVAQAQTEGMPLLTDDVQIKQYFLQTVW